MGSIFDGLISDSGVPTQLEFFGQTVSYVFGESTTLLTAIVGEIEQNETAGSYGRELEERRDFTISTNPNSDWGGVNSPNLSASITFDGISWGVEEISKQTGNFVTLKTIRRQSVERSRPEMRGTR